MIEWRIGLNRVAILVVAAVVGFMIVSSGVALAGVRHQRWPAAYRLLHKSAHRALRRRAVRGDFSPRARTSIVGGTQIAITQAPWQVLVVALIPKPEEKILGLLCGGSIVGETRIVTAGHCVFDPTTGLRTPAEDLFVVAGSADYAKVEPGEQEAKVASVRVHPGFEYALGPGAPDDIAVLTLAKTLTFNTLVQSIGPVAAGVTPAEGTNVNLTGFGRQSPTGKPDGRLYSLGMTVGFSRPCGGPADAVFLCASASEGSGCNGDSGSGLTGGSTVVLVGVMDTGEVISGEPCRASSNNGFVNMAAPEINNFIEGSEIPPQAPRGGGAIVRAVTKVGHLATCEPGFWTGSPTFTYSFVNSANGQTLQSGASATYQFTAADVGRTIYCQVEASNVGGTGVGRTRALSAVEALPSPPTPTPTPTPTTSPQVSGGGGVTSSVQTLPTPSFSSILSLTGTNLAAQRDGSVTVKLVCEGEQSCSGKLTLQVRQTVKKRRGKRTSRVITIGRVSFSIAAGATTDIALHINSSGLALLRTAHGRLTARLQVAQTTPGSAETWTVHLSEPALNGRSKRKK